MIITPGDATLILIGILAIFFNYKLDQFFKGLMELREKLKNET